MAHLYYILPHFVIFVAYMSDNIQGHFFAGQPLFRTLMKKLKKKSDPRPLCKICLWLSSSVADN